MYDVAVIGAGVIGGMLARELTRYQLSVCLLEKESDVAMGASKANSGIVHGGYDPVPGTLKARMNIEGVPLIIEAARELHVPYRENGSLVVAFDEKEDAELEGLYERGKINGVKELRLLSGDEARQLEPALSGAVTKALLVPRAGIVCPYALTIAAVGNAMDNGAELLTDFGVNAVSRSEEGFTVTASDGRQVRARYLVNCAGGYADRVAELAGDGFFRIIPRAGEYLVLDKTEGDTVSRTIFQAPTANGKGILVTPTADGNLLIGPTAVPVAAPDSTETTAEGLAAVQALARKSVPSVNTAAVITSFSGVRASEKSGDFIIEASRRVEGLVHVAAIDSPGLTSCVAIARRAVGILMELGLPLTENKAFDGRRPAMHAFRNLSDREKDAFIREHPAYGRIVCRCEQISEGEILEALHRNPVPTDLDGIKRRTRAGMGRCQGGFCSPYVMKLIARESGRRPETVTKKGGGSKLIDARTGGEDDDRA